MDLTVRQYVDAPVERVWQAWATPEGLASWWWRHWDDTVVEADVRVDGLYRISAHGIVVRGQYRVVARQEQLVMGWVWEDEDGVTPEDRVSVVLVPEGGGTLVIVDHSDGRPDEDAGGGRDLPGGVRPPRDAEADRQATENYRQGWEFTLGELARVLGPTSA